jgi:hypothetical protein
MSIFPSAQRWTESMSRVVRGKFWTLQRRGWAEQEGSLSRIEGPSRSWMVFLGRLAVRKNSGE